MPRPHVTAAPIITDDAIYFANWAGELMALDAASGQQIWRFKPDTQNIRHAGPNQFIAMWGDGHIYAVNRHDGELAWQHAAEGALFHFGSDSGVGLFAEFQPSGVDLHALDLETHEFIWTASNLVAGPPSIHEGVVYFGGVDGTLHGLDLMSGEEVWKLE